MVPVSEIPPQTGDKIMVFDPNVCIGYLVDEHAHPEMDLRPSFLCPTCDDRLNDKVNADRNAHYLMTRGTGKPCGHTDYRNDCLGCYGD
jgi:hypothetical protein